MLNCEDIQEAVLSLLNAQILIVRKHQEIKLKLDHRVIGMT